MFLVVFHTFLVESNIQLNILNVSVRCNVTLRLVNYKNIKSVSCKPIIIIIII